jgi:DNA-binding transcriptional ArsR family regulator
VLSPSAPRGSVTERSERPRDLPPERLQVLAEAMAHPVRAKLLFAVADKSEQGVSIRQLAERVREPTRKVRYHLDALLKLGLVSIASRRSRRGVVERFYRVEVMPSLTTKDLDESGEERARQMSTQVLKAILGDASMAVAGKIFGVRSGHIVVRIPGEVDEQGWGELGSLQERALRESQAVLERSRDRLKSTGDDPVSALVALLLFEVPPWPAP